MGTVLIPFLNKSIQYSLLFLNKTILLVNYWFDPYLKIAAQKHSAWLALILAAPPKHPAYLESFAKLVCWPAGLVWPTPPTECGLVSFMHHQHLVDSQD